MKNILLIRHGTTLGNLERRYIGVTNEPLAPEGVAMLEEAVAKNNYPEIQDLYTSPLLRCTQTAEILYPEMKAKKVEGLREMSFGDFENKNYQELKDNPNYRKWIDSQGEGKYSQGESREDFHSRCMASFEDICKKSRHYHIGIICHGGTIMAILDEYTGKEKDYYHWQVENGKGYQGIFSVNNKQVRDLTKI